jgi:SynChlorMet cassette protein ScmD
MNLQQKPIANPVAVLREEFDDWAVLFNPDTAEAIGINPVGVAIWKQLNGQRTLQEVTAAIQEQFARVPGSAQEEIFNFLTDLEQRGFIGYKVETR